METLERNEWADVAQLVEITSDAVIICELDGTILHVNNRLLGLMCEERADVIGGDVKDVLYSSAFERATEHRLPFETDGSENELMLKLSDGSFIPVLVRAGSVTPPRIFGRRAPRVLVALHSIEEQYSHDRQLKRALSELRVANKRLSGTLSVIMSTVGSDELPSLLDTVLNQLVGTLDASGAAIYFSESGGFKLRGVSRELHDSYLPEFLPYGAGIPTYVLRESRACRLSIQQDLEGDRVASGMFMDLDNRSKHLLRVQDMPPYRSEICLPVFYGTQVLGVLEVGWKRPQAPLAYDLNVLEVICDYLSIQMVGAYVRAARQNLVVRSTCCAMSFLPILMIRSLLRTPSRPKSVPCSIAIFAPLSTMRASKPMLSILRAVAVWRCRAIQSHSSFPSRRRRRAWGHLLMGSRHRCWAGRVPTISGTCALHVWTNPRLWVHG